MQKHIYSVAVASLVFIAAITPNSSRSTPAVAITPTITNHHRHAAVHARRDDEHWTATLNGANELPMAHPGAGMGTVDLKVGANSISWTVSVSGLESPATMAHIHGPGADPDASVIIPFVPFANGVTNGQLSKGMIAREKLPIPMDSIRKLLKDGKLFVNVHTEGYKSGAIRGTLVPAK